MSEEQKKDLKEEEPTSTGGDQPEETKTENESKDEPTVEDLQKQLAESETAREKAEGDRDNYREGFLANKAKNTSLDGDSDDDESEEVVAPKPKEEEEESKEEKIDTRQIIRQEINADNKKQIKQNEHIALKKWLKVNPELGNDALRLKVIDNYANKNGKSVDGIQFDLDRAYKFYKIDNDIPVKKEETKEEIQEINKNASFPTGKGGTPLGNTEFSEQQKQIMKDNNLTPKQWNEWVKYVKAGKMTVDDSVWAIINK